MGFTLFDLEIAKREYNQAKDYWLPIYVECKKDYNFTFGIDQWDADALKVRKGRPCLTINILEPIAKQVINDIRQSNMALRAVPIDEKADIDTAEIYAGIFRNIEKQSIASIAYTTASINAIAGGIGWLTLSTDYCDPMSFDQEIFIDRVLDFSTVYHDPNCVKFCSEDAEYSFIAYDYTKEQFKEEWPDRQPISFDGDGSKDDIRIVKYFKKIYSDETIHKITLIDDSEQIVTEDQKKLLDENLIEYNIISTRKTKSHVVMCCLLNGEDEPLEETEFVGQYIPVVPVIGNELFVDGKRIYRSLINPSKDSQRSLNYLTSANMEIIALQPKAPWVGAVGSFKSDPDSWLTANTANHAVLQYDVVFNGDQRIEPPTRQEPPRGSMGMAQEAMQTKENIMLSVGMPQANMGQQGNELSGIAIRNRQIEGDNGMFNFSDNLAYSMSFLGRIAIDVIRVLYRERTIARILGKDDKGQLVPINAPYIKEGDTYKAAKGQSDGIFDFGVGKYDVDVSIGASYSSQRQEMADKLTQIVSSDPSMMATVGDLLFKALDVPDSDIIAERIQATMNPALLKDDPNAARMLEAQAALEQLNEQVLTLDAALQNKEKNAKFEQSIKLRELLNDSQKVANDTLKTQAEVEKMRAETKGFNMGLLAPLSNSVFAINEQLTDMTQAIEEIIQAKELENQETLPPVIGNAQPIESAINV